MTYLCSSNCSFCKPLDVERCSLRTKGILTHGPVCWLLQRGLHHHCFVALQPLQREGPLFLTNSFSCSWFLLTKPTTCCPPTLFCLGSGGTTPINTSPSPFLIPVLPPCSQGHSPPPLRLIQASPCSEARANRILSLDRGRSHCSLSPLKKKTPQNLNSLPQD